MESVETAFLPLPEGLTLESVHPRESSVVVRITCRSSSAGCRVLLKLVVRKFVCGTLTCPQQIFTERLSDFVQS